MLKKKKSATLDTSAFVPVWTVCRCTWRGTCMYLHTVYLHTASCHMCPPPRHPRAQPSPAQLTLVLSPTNHPTDEAGNAAWPPVLSCLLGWTAALQWSKSVKASTWFVVSRLRGHGLETPWGGGKKDNCEIEPATTTLYHLKAYVTLWGEKTSRSFWLLN